MSQTNGQDELEKPAWREIISPQEVRRYYAIRHGVMVRDTILIWAVIAIAFWLWAWTDSAFVWPLCALLVASRQHALNNGVHDGAHFLLFRNNSSTSGTQATRERLTPMYSSI